MSEHKAPPPPRASVRGVRLPRAEIVIVALGVLVVAGIGALAIGFIALSGDLQTANKARDQLAAQVQRLGGTPVAGPPGSRGMPGPVSTVAGPQGPRGPRGEAGASGMPAPTITPRPGASGAAGRPGADSTVPGPQGSPGAQGGAGPSGSPGPAGAEGSPGPAGPAGQDGRNGTDGRDGVDGRDGSPPASWSWTDPAGTAYTCTRSGGSDSSPTYSCAPGTAPTGPPPSGGSGAPSQPALAPDRRKS